MFIAVYRTRLSPLSNSFTVDADDLFAAKTIADKRVARMPTPADVLAVYPFAKPPAGFFKTYRATDSAGYSLISVSAIDEPEAQAKLIEQLNRPGRTAFYNIWIAAGRPVRVE